MARLYSDENFDVHTMDALQDKGHDTLTARDAGQTNMKIPDSEVLDFATKHKRAVVTFDRRDYLNLHKQNPEHSGIIACTFDPDSQSLADRIHQTILDEQDNLENKFLRVYRPQS